SPATVASGASTASRNISRSRPSPATTPRKLPGARADREGCRLPKGGRHFFDQNHRQAQAGVNVRSTRRRRNKKKVEDAREEDHRCACRADVADSCRAGPDSEGPARRSAGEVEQTDRAVQD